MNSNGNSMATLKHWNKKIGRNSHSLVWKADILDQSCLEFRPELFSHLSRRSTSSYILLPACAETNWPGIVRASKYMPARDEWKIFSLRIIVRCGQIRFQILSKPLQLTIATTVARRMILSQNQSSIYSNMTESSSERFRDILSACGCCMVNDSRHRLQLQLCL